jgi:hypothetical protein
MFGPDPLTTLYHALEQMPGDPVTLMALADYYLELDQLDASACLRWTVSRNYCPFRYSPGSLTVMSAGWNAGWYWWAIDDPHLAANWGHPQTCRLPRGLWRHLRHTFDYVPSVFKQYPTCREAYEALIEAWPLAPAFDRVIVRREIPR